MNDHSPPREPAPPGSAETITAPWRPLLKIAAAAAVAVLALMPVQMIVYIASPPPTTAPDFFALFQRSKLLGLLALDLLYMLDILLMLPIFVALYAVLRRSAESLMTLALAGALVATAIYFASNTSFSMLLLSDRHAAAATAAERSSLLAAGEAMLALYNGTAYAVSYVLSAIVGLTIGAVMLKSGVFSQLTAVMCLLTNAFGLVPPTAGRIGFVFSFLSLLPLVVWLALVARRFVQLARTVPSHPAAAAGQPGVRGLHPQEAH